MNILVANNHLKDIGGSETFTYTLIEELLNRGFEVEYFTFEKGITSDKIEKKLGASYKSKSRYDLILANHITCVKFLCKMGYTIQTCHGIYPELEQPSKFADYHVAISEEVKNHLFSCGFTSKIIRNGINCDRFFPKQKINKTLLSVLSLSQSVEANKMIEEACRELEIKFDKFDKFENPIWDIEVEINKVDLVIGLGRSAYDAMACGRAVLVYDYRPYSESYADGYLNKENLFLSMVNNCSGRYYKFKFDKDDLINELKKYTPQDGDFLREVALKNFNIKDSVNHYLEIKKSAKFYNRYLKVFKIKLEKKIGKIKNGKNPF